MAGPDRTQDAALETAGTADASARFWITVQAPIEHAFRVFTERLDSWWPREHHIGTAEKAVAILEPRRPRGQSSGPAVDGST